MNELIVFLLMSVVAYIFIPAEVIKRIFSNQAEKNTLATVSVAKPTLLIPEDSMLRRHFLTHLRTEIEAELIPRPIDSTLRHYYDASVAAEFQKRLSGITVE